MPLFLDIDLLSNLRLPIYTRLLYTFNAIFYVGGA